MTKSHGKASSLQPFLKAEAHLKRFRQVAAPPIGRHRKSTPIGACRIGLFLFPRLGRAPLPGKSLRNGLFRNRRPESLGAYQGHGGANATPGFPSGPVNGSNAALCASPQTHPATWPIRSLANASPLSEVRVEARQQGRVLRRQRCGPPTQADRYLPSEA
jgi:hypothetical protein